MSASDEGDRDSCHEDNSWSRHAATPTSSTSSTSSTFPRRDGTRRRAQVNANWCIMEASLMNERVAYLIFVTAVFTGLALLTVGLVAIVIALIRRHRRAESH
jgi:hypothetical protein